MTIWIASSNRENWDIAEKKNIWGVPKRSGKIIQRVRPGDIIIFYVGQQRIDDKILPSAITGAYEVISEPYEDYSPVFNTPKRMVCETFPYRIRIRPKKIFEEPLEFKPLIPYLKFITNKTMWSGHLRQAMREIPDEDYQLIIQAAK